MCVGVDWDLTDGFDGWEVLVEGCFLASCLIALFAAFFASFLAAPFEIFGSAGPSGRMFLASVRSARRLLVSKDSTESDGAPVGVVSIVGDLAQVYDRCPRQVSFISHHRSSIIGTFDPHLDLSEPEDRGLPEDE